ncbi:helix-turn-helix domain-containing protein [Amycolatopsis thailandensis]|uniref:helix-turn-helix domain-containing protein n=1 Tax=Amycolatopsis thailandensis TaxID=589330 RepID=UPI003649668B
MEPSAQERAFASEVERHRAAARVSQEWVARQVGMSRPKISEVCAGRYLPTRPTLDNLVTALAMERDRAVELWQAACEGRRQRIQAEKQARYPVPDSWTALSVPTAEVRSLLRAQIETATDMPYRLPGARATSLATVYVRQELGSGIEDAQVEPRPEPVLDERGILFLPAPPVPRLTVRPPSRAVRQALDDHEHLVITGGPGQGKSTLSLRLTAEIATKWLHLNGDGPIPLTEPVLPLRLTARVLAAQLELPFPQALAACVLVEFGSLLTTVITADLLAARVVGCRWLLMIDGLDEVADPVARHRLVKALALHANDSPYRVVLTTRPLEGATLAPLQRAAAHYELQPFDDAAFRDFAGHWFTEPDTTARFLHEVRQAHLGELIRLPLLATIAAIIFEQHRSRPLPDNRYALYESYMEFLRSGRTLPPGQFDRMGTGLLEHLGLVRLEADTSLSVAARDWVEERTADLPLGWTDELSAYLGSTGLLVRRSDDLQFLHHSFAEHLAATGKARLLPERFDPEHEDFRRLLHAARQEEAGRLARAVLLHYTHLHRDQADPLIIRLHAGTAAEQLIAARLIAQHVPASSDVIDDFLVTARQWATIVRYTAGEILNQVCRATYHPGLTAWLIDLMRDEAMPWRSRVDSAAALAVRMPNPCRSEAVDLLCTVTEDIAVPVAPRLAAAEALTQCGPTERTSAERGLEAVLDDPLTEPYRRKEAAVVLAGVSRDGYAKASRALIERLADPATRNAERVELAAGLVEIGTEFHERSAEVFRQVLHSRSRTTVGCEAAAIGLAALGSDHLAEAVNALTDLVNNRDLYYFERAEAARTLARMGPQYLRAAAGHLRAMTAEPGTSRVALAKYAESLAGLGFEFHGEAADCLMSTLAGPAPETTAILSAAQGLARLGPEFHDVATAQLRRVTDDPLAGGIERARALSQLAEFGAQHRADAVEGLRAILHDSDAEAEARCWAADELLGLGTELHAEVADALLVIVQADRDPNVVINACRTLNALGRRYSDFVDQAIHQAARSPAVTASTLFNAATLLSSSPARLARDRLSELMQDSKQSAWTRTMAAGYFVRRTDGFAEVAVRTLLEILRHQAGGALLRVDLVTRKLVDAGGSHAAMIAAQVRALLSNPDLGTVEARQATTALIELGCADSPDVIAALATIVSDDSAPASIRCSAAVDLGTLSTDCTATAIAVLRDMAGEEGASRDVILGLERLGEDVLPLLKATVNDRNRLRGDRETAASLLAAVAPDLAEVAEGELRHQAADPYLNLWVRADAMTSWAEVSASARDEAIAFFGTVTADECEPPDERCYAAEQLVLLDRSRWEFSVTVVRRLLSDPRVSASDQFYCARQLRDLNDLRSDQLSGFAAAMFYHPEADADDLISAARRLQGPIQHATWLELLADHTVPIKDRLPGNVLRDGETYAPHVEAALREVCTEIEFSRGERVEAAKNLGQLVPRLIPEAVETLRKISTRADNSGFDALVALAGFGGPWWREVAESRERIVIDGAEQQGRRLAAALVLHVVGAALSEPVLEFLREIASSRQQSDLNRVTSLFALREFSGLDELRAIREDSQSATHIRCEIASRLARYAVEDRAAAARILSASAGDFSARPAMRCRAAKELAELGLAGRAQAVEKLEQIMIDEKLPIITRAEAAHALARHRPTEVNAALHWLRMLSEAERPLQRVQVLLRLGKLDSTEAVPSLRRMAGDRDLGPVARLRSAEALMRLRRDQREAASVVVLELARSAHVPVHVRARAARKLALWSELCRDEARDILRRLAETHRH